MAYFAVQYVYSNDAAELDKLRPAHRAFLASLTDGPLVASGPIMGAARALLILHSESAAEVTAMLNEDPFWTANLIAERTVDEWNPLIGVFAAKA